MVEHHALRQQVREGLAFAHQAEVAHHLVPEARIQQVQDGVLDAADVLLHWHPVVGASVDHGRGVVASAVAGVVPAAVDERVHGVGLALRRAAAGGAGAVEEVRAVAQRVAGAVRHAVLGQHHRQLLIRHRHIAAARAVDDRDRAAPVALAADTPIAQAPLHLFVAQPAGGQVSGDRIDRLGIALAVVGAGVHAAAVLAGVPLVPFVRGEGLSGQVDDRLDGEAVLAGEAKVALVMRRHRHHRALAVAHQHVVADPHRHRLAGQRVGDVQAGRDAFLLLRGELGLLLSALAAFVDKCCNGWIQRRRVQRQRMLGGDRAEGHAHDGVGAGGEHPQLAVANRCARGIPNIVGEGKAHTSALADPVGLHGAHALRPATERVQTRQQLLGVLRDAQVITRNLALLDQCAGAPATAVNDLLVGEHRLVDRVPIDCLRLLVGDALLEHAQEQPLVPAVVVRLAGGELAFPVDGQAQRLQLALHVGDVAVGPLRRRHLVLDGGVLSWQTEGVPAHRLQHIEAARGVPARQHIADGVVADVPHVQLARGIGEHRQAVIAALARDRRVLDGTKSVVRGPVLLGGGLDGVGLVQGLHGGTGLQAKPRL